MLLDRNDGVLLVAGRAGEADAGDAPDLAGGAEGHRDADPQRRALDVPVLFAEQYPKGLGPTLPDLMALAPDAPVVPKVRFSAVGEPALLDHLEGIGRRTIVICGLESHVCVLQTAFDLHDAGFRPVVAIDATTAQAPRSTAVAELLAGAGRHRDRDRRDGLARMAGRGCDRRVPHGSAPSCDDPAGPVPARPAVRRRPVDGAAERPSRPGGRWRWPAWPGPIRWPGWPRPPWPRRRRVSPWPGCRWAAMSRSRSCAGRRSGWPAWRCSTPRPGRTRRSRGAAAGAP